jgi:hypothetical protein
MPPDPLRLSLELRPRIADEEGETQREEAGGETFAGAAFGRPTVGERLCTGQRTVAIPDIAGHQPRPVALCLVDRDVLPAVVDWGAAGPGR